jgi:GNAT superfamily N-acetyltransferase
MSFLPEEKKRKRSQKEYVAYNPDDDEDLSKSEYKKSRAYIQEFLSNYGMKIQWTTRGELQNEMSGGIDMSAFERLPNSLKNQADIYKKEKVYIVRDIKETIVIGGVITFTCRDQFKQKYTAIDYIEVLEEHRGKGIAKALLLYCIKRNRPLYIPEGEVPHLYNTVGFVSLGGLNEQRSEDSYPNIDMRCGSEYELTAHTMINLFPNRTLQLDNVKDMFEQYFNSESESE